MLKRYSSTRYERDALRPVLQQALSEVGALTAIAANGGKVLLKPNFVMPSAPDDPSTTHPAFYMTLAALLQDAGFTVGIGESPAFGSCAAALARHGVLDECRARGIEVVEFRTSRTYAGVAGDRWFSELTVAAELSDWPSIINVPKLKTHKQFVFTGATKNLYGCVTGKRKFMRHNLCANDPVRFARMILANAREIGCVAHIADGVHAAHITGPRGGAPYPLGCILAGDDPLALDWAFCLATALEADRTPLFQALEAPEREALAAQAEAAMRGFEVARDFIHAPLIHIGFGPIAVARSVARTARHRLGLDVHA